MSPLGESPERDRLEPLRTETFLRTLPSLRRAGCRVTRYGAPCPASASSEGGRSLRRSTCDTPASLRLPFLPESSARRPWVRCRRGRAPRGLMRPDRRGAQPRRTLGGTVREGNEVGGDAAVLECRDLPGMDPWMPAPLPSAAPPTAPRYGASGTAGGRRKPDFPLTGGCGPTYLFGLTVYNIRLDQ